MEGGAGEAEEGVVGGTVHFSKQEMNSPCCGHLSLGREGKGGGYQPVAQSPCYPLKTETHQSSSRRSSSGSDLDRPLGLKPTAMEERASEM